MRRIGRWAAVLGLCGGACAGAGGGKGAGGAGGADTAPGDGGAGDGGAGDGGAGDGGAGDGGGDGGSGPVYDTCPGGESGGPGSVALSAVAGDITWAIDFDAAAEALGKVDCTYRRTAEGMQVQAHGHLCPGCDLVAAVDATLVEGAACVESIGSAATAVRTETWALDPAGGFYRSGVFPGPLREALAAVDRAGAGGDVPVAWESTATLDTGGGFTLRAAGTLRWDAAPSRSAPDALGPRAAAYACGWECNDPGGAVPSVGLETGGRLYPGRFVDACGEGVDLWDFAGSWLVVDTAQPDCGPCRAMAASHGPFVAQMAAEGIRVRVVTLLGAGLSAPWATPEVGVLDAWVAEYGDDQPVLLDRGYGAALFPPYAEGETGESFGYPTWVVVDPSLTVRAVNVGFGSWDDVAAVIRTLEAGGAGG